MSNINRNVATHQKISNKCKDKKVTDAMIKKYRCDATSATESVISMSEVVSELNKKYIANEIDINDVNYFCTEVGLDKKSSQFRKYVCIGNNANRFKEYIKKFPSTISVLYEITTLDADIFESLIINDQIQPGLTLKQLKFLGGKAHPMRNLIKQSSKNTSQSMIIDFDSENLSESSKEILIKFYRQISSIDDIGVSFTQEDAISDYIRNKIDEDDFIDVPSKEANDLKMIKK